MLQHFGIKKTDDLHSSITIMGLRMIDEVWTYYANPTYARERLNGNLRQTFSSVGSAMARLNAIAAEFHLPLWEITYHFSGVTSRDGMPTDVRLDYNFLLYVENSDSVPVVYTWGRYDQWLHKSGTFYDVNGWFRNSFVKVTDNDPTDFAVVDSMTDYDGFAMPPHLYKCDAMTFDVVYKTNPMALISRIEQYMLSAEYPKARAKARPLNPCSFKWAYYMYDCNGAEGPKDDNGHSIIEETTMSIPVKNSKRTEKY